MKIFIHLMPFILLAIANIAHAGDEDFPLLPTPTPQQPAEPAVTAPPAKIPNNRFYLSADLYKPNILDSSSTAIRPTLEYEHIFPKKFLKNISVGGILSYYSIPSSVSIHRTEIAFQGGYWFFDRTLKVSFRAGGTSTNIDTYSSGDSEYYGFDAKYVIPITDHFEWFFDLGWAHYGSTTLTRDTGVPVTNDPTTNDLCTIFTFGIANGCGDRIDSVTIPSFNSVHAATGLGLKF